MPAHFLNINRAKRSITLNLKEGRGKAILTELVKSADVLIQNFRPGVVERLGIAEPDFRELAPQLIYVSVSGFGEKGPLAGEPVYDPIIQAMSGLTTIQAGSDDERPRLVRTILPDKLTSVVTAQAITAALLARSKTGQGQHVRLSMLDSVINFLWASDMGAYTFPDKEIPAQKAASFIDLIYETADGYMTASTMGNKEWSALSRAFDMPELLEDERFKTPALRDQNVNERLELIQRVLRERSTAYWLDAFAREGVPAAPALKRAEVIEHPQVVASDILVDLEHPVAGRLRQTRPAARFEKTPAKPGVGAPRLGEHTDELLAELGYTVEDIRELRTAGVIGQETYGSAES
jgi:crotonobetainyl-CoA:carnitine CoA-transferase CaiB-like acyl-CoA transferase